MARTLVELPDDLVQRAMKLTGARSKKEMITRAIEELAALWNGALVRAADVNDLVIAVTAIVHGAVVLHDDADYEHIAKVSELNQTWVVPRRSAS